MPKEVASRDIEGDYYRFVSPCWACEPVSGEGAAKTGNRFNEKGVPTLYLSKQVDTAWEEYSAKGLRPATLVVYHIKARGLVDLSDRDSCLALNFNPGDLLSEWEDISRREGDCPTWRLARRLVAEGRPGLLVPSSERDNGLNLVLWLDNCRDRVAITVYDPDRELPASQASWVEADRA